MTRAHGQDTTRNDRQQDRQAHHDGRVDFRELRDEALALGLALRGVLHEVQDLRGRRLAERLRRTDPQHARQVHAARQDFFVRADAPGHALAREGDRVQVRAAFQDDAVHGHLLAGLDDDDLAGRDRFGCDRHDTAVSFHMGRIGPDVHQVGDRFPAAAFRDALEELAHLEEQHDEHRLGELRLGARQEADGECAQRGDGHEEILVQGLAVHQRLGRLRQCFPTDNQIRNQVNEEIGPYRPVRLLFDDDRRDEQHGRERDLDDGLLDAALFVVMMVLVLMLMPMVLMVLVPMAMLAGFFVMMVMIFVYHSPVCFPKAKVRRPVCNRVAIFAGNG